MTVLLLGANSYGTLAAARAFGAMNVKVIMADPERSGFALSSRFVTERRICPETSDTSRLLAWLLEQGRAAPKSLVLYPTSDHLAWLFAVHREELAPLFRIYHPDEPTIFSLLDKHRLSLAAAAVGLEMPPTRLAEAGTLEAVAREMTFPLLLKPRTQVFMSSGLKGVLVLSVGELKEKVAMFRRFIVYDEALRSRHPEVNSPLIQEYLPAAETGVFSVSGFRSREGELAVRAALKVLQRPRKLGIGLCFESQPVEQKLVDKLSALCAEVGYFGTFEAEFIVSGSKRYLIDFNPRFYSQMGFDHARGLNHAMLAYFGALGEQREVSRLLGEARAWRAQGEEAYCHRGMLELLLNVQRVSGHMTGEQVARWREWLIDRRARLVDAAWSREDPMPAMMDSARWAGHFFRHPRTFLRHYVLNQ